MVVFALLEKAAASRRSVFFYATAAFLIAFFALAAIHELIPGLCIEDDRPGEECPFCHLVKSLTLIVALLLTLAFWVAVRERLLALAQLCPHLLFQTRFLRRAPPSN